jgi:hypothetical protein
MTYTSPFSSGYQEPQKPSKYLKLTEGVHLIHLLTPPQEVVSYFVEFLEGSDGKKQKICTPDLGDGTYPANTKRTWAFKIWNYDTQEIQVWEVSQKSIQSYLSAIPQGKIKNDWLKYPIQITRKGDKMDTEYLLDKGDTSLIPAEAEKAKANTYVNLSAMIAGQDPFDSDIVVQSPGRDDMSDDTPLPVINVDDVKVQMPF